MPLMRDVGVTLAFAALVACGTVPAAPAAPTTPRATPAPAYPDAFAFGALAFCPPRIIAGPPGRVGVVIVAYAHANLLLVGPRSVAGPWVWLLGSIGLR